MEVSSPIGIHDHFYNIFSDKPYSNLKPGQTSLERNYYEKATHEKPNG